jgi:hypothetical protein
MSNNDNEAIEVKAYLLLSESTTDSGAIPKTRQLQETVAGCFAFLRKRLI